MLLDIDKEEMNTPAYVILFMNSYNSVINDNPNWKYLNCASPGDGQTQNNLLDGA